MKRRTSDFDEPGRRRFTERNPRGKDAEWLHIACTVPETDRIMRAVGMAADQQDGTQIAFGALVAQICEEWMAIHEAPEPEKGQTDR